jgi:hypothetical protein
MMTSFVESIPRLPRYIPYAWIFVLVVLVCIGLIFVRVYVLGDWFARRAARRSGGHSARQVTRGQRHTENHGSHESHGSHAGHGNRKHQTRSKRRAHRP